MRSSRHSITRNDSPFHSRTSIPSCTRERRAFTRIEMLACLACVALLGALVLPAFATGQSRSQAAQCFNNLRLIGRGVQMWGMEFGDSTPWRTRTSDGGLLQTPPATRPGNAWFEFFAFSNQLVTPAILACPSDAGVRRADDFSALINIQYRSAAVSYVIGLESRGQLPCSWVSGDRNLGGVSPGGQCSAGVVNVSTVNFGPFNIATWTNNVHGQSGNILLMDGSVEFTSTSRLNALLGPTPSDDNGPTHFLRAR